MQTAAGSDRKQTALGGRGLDRSGYESSGRSLTFGFVGSSDEGGLAEGCTNDFRGIAEAGTPERRALVGTGTFGLYLRGGTGIPRIASERK